jgi:predicted Zn-dependent protease
MTVTLNKPATAAITYDELGQFAHTIDRMRSVAKVGEVVVHLEPGETGISNAPCDCSPGVTFIAADPADPHLLGTMAHEMAHMNLDFPGWTREDTVRSVFLATAPFLAGVTAAWTLGVGMAWPFPLLWALVAVGTYLLRFSWRRGVERRADAMGVDILDSLGMDGATIMWRNLQHATEQDDHPWPWWHRPFDTHPAPAARMRSLNKSIARLHTRR